MDTKERKENLERLVEKYEDEARKRKLEGREQEAEQMRLAATRTKHQLQDLERRIRLREVRNR